MTRAAQRLLSRVAEPFTGLARAENGAAAIYELAQQGLDQAPDLTAIQAVANNAASRNAWARR